MAQFDLYVDTYSGDPVAGPGNPSVVPLPKFIQGDTISLRIYLLARLTTFTNPLGPYYSIVNNSTLSIKVALGPKDGTAGSTLYTQQFTWVAGGGNTYFEANLPLNTAAITSLIGGATAAAAWFEIEYTQGGFPTTVLQKAVQIEAEVIETGTITVPPGLTAMTAEEANAIFLKRTNTGFFLLNETTGHKVFVYLGDDDAVHMDPVTP
jgi:hypothetical protein